MKWRKWLGRWLESPRKPIGEVAVEQLNCAEAHLWIALNALRKLGRDDDGRVASLATGALSDVRKALREIDRRGLGVESV